MFGQQIIIPRGKQVHFTGIEALQDKHFLLEGDVTLRLSSNYQSPVGNVGGDLYTAYLAAIGAAKSISKDTINLPASFQQLGFQQWTGTDPLSVSFEIGIYMETTAYEDVILPAKAIMGLALPTLIGDTGGLSAPGPALYDVLLNKQGASHLINIQLGPCKLKNCILKSADVTFSEEVEENTYYPIWAKIIVGVSTVYTANTGMLDDMFISTDRTLDLIKHENNI